MEDALMCKHPILQMAKDNANFSVNTDDTTVTGTGLQDEFELLRTWGLNEVHFTRAVSLYFEFVFNFYFLSIFLLVLQHSVQIFNNVFLGAGLCDARRVSQLWSEILFSMSSDSSNQLRMKQTDVGYCQLKNLLLKHIELMFFKIRKTDLSILSYKRLFSCDLFHQKVKWKSKLMIF